MKKMKLSLLAATTTPVVFGSQKGREAYAALNKLIHEHKDCTLFEISLEGMQAVDATFVRESVVNLAKSFRGLKGFYLTNSPTAQISSNWTYAALVKNQPLLALIDGKPQWIGIKLTQSMQELLDYIYARNTINSVELAKDFDLSLAHASIKLKKLFDDGYLLRQKLPNQSGGIEYSYHPIFQQ